MNIDRTKFLFLTGAISAGVLAACSSSDKTTTTGQPTGMNDASTTNPSTGDAASDFDSSTTEGGDDGSTESEAGSDAAAACDDSVGAATNSCTPYFSDAGYPTSEGGDAAADAAAASTCLGTTSCIDIRLYAKPVVADSISNCLGMLPTCELITDRQPCYEAALQAACPDTTTATVCQQAVDLCSGDSGTDAGAAAALVSDCEATLNGLTDTGRQAYLTCISESATSCPTSFYDQTCLDEIFGQ